MITITARHMVGGFRNEHIASVRWRHLGTGELGESTREQMVQWLDENQANNAIVGVYPLNHVYVTTVHRQNAPHYIRTRANNEWTDNLLALPEY